MIPVSENVAEPTVEQARIRQVDVEVVVGPPVFTGRYLAATGDGEVTIRSIKLPLDLKRKIVAGFEVEVGDVEECFCDSIWLSIVVYNEL